MTSWFTIIVHTVIVLLSRAPESILLLPCCLSFAFSNVFGSQSIILWGKWDFLSWMQTIYSRVRNCGPGGHHWLSHLSSPKPPRCFATSSVTSMKTTRSGLWHGITNNYSPRFDLGSPTSGCLHQLRLSPGLAAENATPLYAYLQQPVRMQQQERRQPVYDNVCPRCQTSLNLLLRLPPVSGTYTWKV